MTFNDPAGLSTRDRKRAESRWAVAMLVGLSMTAPLAIDMFLPSMPNMAEEFEASTSTIQLAVTLFLLAFAASQLVYGPLSDRFGRRPALIAGLVLFVAGGVLSLFAWSAETLIVGRIIQGIGGGAGPAIARAMVLDVFGRSRAARVMAYMTIATPLAPTIAPIIGGVLQDLFDWRAVFVTLIGIGVFLLVAYRLVLPETNVRRDRSALGAVQMSRNYRELFSSRTFLAYALTMGLMFSGQLVFISGSSFVLIDELGLSPGQFGLAFGFAAVGNHERGVAVEPAGDALDELAGGAARRRLRRERRGCDGGARLGRRRQSVGRGAADVRLRRGTRTGPPAGDGRRDDPLRAHGGPRLGGARLRPDGLSPRSTTSASAC